MKRTTIIIATIIYAVLSCNDIQGQTENFAHACDSTELKLPGYDFDDTKLEEVVVTAKKKLVESDGATLSYNVEEDPDSKSSTVIEMLRKVPMVSVDAEDNIRVKGEQNFKIYINGKEDPMLSGDPKTVLKSMPATSIKKIEVITEPGAKYEADGTGGILNIITDKKNALEGYLLNINASMRRDGMNAGLYGRTKIGNVTMSANGSMSNSLGLTLDEEASVTQNYYGDNPKTLVRKTDNYKVDNKYYQGSFNMSWEADTMNLMTVSFYYGNSEGTQNFQEHDYMTDNLTGIRIYSMNQNTHYKWGGTWLGTELSYQHTFGREDHHIVGSYIFNHGTRNNDQDFERYNVENYPFPYTPIFQTNQTGYYNKHSLQIDYSNTFGKKHTLEAGFKGIIYPSDSHNYNLEGNDLSSLIVSSDDDIRLKQTQNIMAAYTSYTAKFGKFGYRAGVRYEYTHYGVSYPDGKGDGFNTNLNDFVPNAALHFSFRQNTLRAAYQMRISRPSIYNLNPYRETGDIGTVSYGNPDLKSERLNQVTISWSNYGGPVGGQLQLGYGHVGNAINNYMFLKDGMMNVTYLNLGKKESFGLDGNLQWRMTNVMNFGLSGNVSYNKWQCDDERLKINTGKWSGNASGNWDWSMPRDFRMTAYGGWGCHAAMQQSNTMNWYYYGLSLGKSLLKEKRLTVTAGLQTLLPARRTYSRTTRTEGLDMTMKASESQWSCSIGVSYRLGKLRNDVRRTAADIEKVEGESGGGGLPRN